MKALTRSTLLAIPLAFLILTVLPRHGTFLWDYLLAYGRDLRQLPSLIWGGLFFVALQFVVHGILQATGKPNFYSGQLPESETTVAR